MDSEHLERGFGASRVLGGYKTTSDMGAPSFRCAFRDHLGYIWVLWSQDPGVNCMQAGSGYRQVLTHCNLKAHVSGIMGLGFRALRLLGIHVLPSLPEMKGLGMPGVSPV